MNHLSDRGSQDCLASPWLPDGNTDGGVSNHPKYCTAGGTLPSLQRDSQRYVLKLLTRGTLPPPREDCPALFTLPIATSHTVIFSLSVATSSPPLSLPLIGLLFQLPPSLLSLLSEDHLPPSPRGQPFIKASPTTLSTDLPTQYHQPRHTITTSPHTTSRHHYTL